MTIGVSTYALSQAVRAGQMTPLDVIQWIADNGGDFVEVVPSGFDLEQDPGLIGQLRDKAGELGIPIRHYCISASFSGKSGQEWQSEVDRVKRHVDIVRELGATMMRHDISKRPLEQSGLDFFEDDLPAMVEASQNIADYAASYGITTSIENHGRLVATSERVQRVIRLVNRPNFKTTIDVGNFAGAGEDPLSAVKKNLPFASMIHLKDTFVRCPDANPGEGFSQWAHGVYKRATIVGHGDLNIREIIRTIKHSGYTGPLSIEFEGIEECRMATRIGLANAKRIWNEV